MKGYEKHELPEALLKPIDPEELAKVAIDWQALAEAHNAETPTIPTESQNYNANSRNVSAIVNADDRRTGAYGWEPETEPASAAGEAGE